MRFVTALRWTASFWFFPALFALTCVVAAQNTWRSGYAVGDIASAGTGLDLAGPMVAAFVALRFRGFPRFVRTLRSSRSGISLVLCAWWPLLLGAPVVLGSAILVSAAAVPLDRDGWTLLTVYLVAALACALVGLTLSWALPAVVAVPVAAVGLFLWFAYLPASDSALLHNLNSTFTACCTANTRPADVAVLASLAVTGVVCIGVLLLLAPVRWADGSRIVLAPVLAVLLGLALLSGVGVARSSSEPLELVPVSPRTTELACRDAGQVRVCVWPEDVARTDPLTAIAARANQHLGRWGLMPMTLLAEGGRGSGAVDVTASSDLSNQDLHHSIAAGYVDRMSGCADAAGPERDERVALMALAAGLTRTDLASRFPAAVVAVASERFDQARSSPAAVRDWFGAGLRCGSVR